MKAICLLCSWLALVVSGFAGEAPAPAGEAYEVRLARPTKAGDDFKIDARVAFQMETTNKLGDLPSDEDKINIATKLTGELTVVSVTAKGLARELRLKLGTVESFDDGETAELFKAGDVISMKHGAEKDDITVNGEAPDDMQSELIDALLNVADDDEATDDEAFGTKNKVKVGDEWAANRNVLVAEMARQNMNGLKPEDFTATARLAEASTVDSQPALRVVCDMKFDSQRATLPNLDEGMKTKHVGAEVRSEMDVPVDPASLAMHARTLLKFEFEAAGQSRDEEGQNIDARIKVKRRAAIDATETPIK